MHTASPRAESFLPVLLVLFIGLGEWLLDASINLDGNLRLQ